MTDVKRTFFNGDPDQFKSQMQHYVDLFGVSSNDIKNLSIAALVGQFMSQTDDAGIMGQLDNLMGMAKSLGLADKKASTLKLANKSNT